MECRSKPYPASHQRKGSECWRTRHFCGVPIVVDRDRGSEPISQSGFRDDALRDQAASATRSFVARTLVTRLSMLKDPAPKATTCSSPPAIMTFFRKWIIWF